MKLKDFSINKMVIVLFIFMAAVGFFNSGVAEAGADIHWKTTSVSISPGSTTINGYFYNNGNATGSIYKFRIYGYIAQYAIDCTFVDSNITVGPISAGKSKNWSFKVTDRNISYYDSSPAYNFDTRVWWR